jgi:hypothetical protein
VLISAIPGGTKLFAIQLLHEKRSAVGRISTVHANRMRCSMAGSLGRLAAHLEDQRLLWTIGGRYATGIFWNRRILAQLLDKNPDLLLASFLVPASALFDALLSSTCGKHGCAKRAIGRCCRRVSTSGAGLL